MDSLRQELSNGGLESVLTLLVRWQINYSCASRSSVAFPPQSSASLSALMGGLAPMRIARRGKVCGNVTPTSRLEARRFSSHRRAAVSFSSHHSCISLRRFLSSQHCQTLAASCRTVSSCSLNLYQCALLSSVQRQRTSLYRLRYILRRRRRPYFLWRRTARKLFNKKGERSILSQKGATKHFEVNFWKIKTSELAFASQNL